ncbi:MAG: hypothetical protein FWF35_02265 [Elusimicrobia bacterium]|nr:hypothetical protein [Elusimicrobiota bacterium]
MANLISYLIPLGFTLAVETSLAAVITREKKFVLLCVIVNILTNPAANMIARSWPEVFFGTTYAIPIMEVFIVLIEWGFYCAFYKKKYVFLFFFSLLANAASYLVGLLLF